MATKSLKIRRNPLSSTDYQIDFLSKGIFEDGSFPSFEEKIKQNDLDYLSPKDLEILQLNLGYMCNQVCSHCHVDAGPDRKEMMSREILEKSIEILQQTSINTLDLTGGAPEMHPEFRWLVENASKEKIHDLIVRSNLTIIMANERFYDLPDFFASNNVHVISSLPFYKKEKTDRQRGEGVFSKSIDALKMLNKVGYGKEGSSLKLDLVYNPSGAFLPASQEILENDYKEVLFSEFGIEFNNLFTITNLPISRFLEYLIASENYEHYMSTLVNSFNPSTLSNLMCTNTLSVSWDGNLFDCDFNQMLDLGVESKVKNIKDFDLKLLQNRKISVSQHCYGCTAGSGSSCQGTIT